MPMARHRPALDSTGTAPDHRQPLPNFNPGNELLPLNQPALCLLAAMQPVRLTVAPEHSRELRRFPHWRNGEPVHPLTPKPAHFRFQLLRQQPNAPPITRLARCATECRNLATFAGPTNSKKTPLANSR